MTTATQRHNGRTKRANGHNGHDLTARLNSLRGDIGALQRDVRGFVSDVSASAENQLSGTVKSARQAVRGVEDWGAQNVKTVRQTVRKQPVMACMIAAGAGAILGMCLSFRGRSE